MTSFCVDGDPYSPYSPDYGYYGYYGYYGSCGEGYEESYAAFAAIYDPVAALQQLVLLPGSEVLEAGVSVGKYDKGSYSDLSGRLRLADYSDVATSFMQLKVSASLALSGIEGLPEARAAVVVDRNQFKGGNASLLVKWGDEQYSFQLDDVDVEQQTGALTVTSPLGVSLQLKDIAIADKSGTGALYVGSTKVADVKTLDSGAIKISYIDGTFETLQ